MGAALTTTSFFLHGRTHSTQTGYLSHVSKYSSKVQTEMVVPFGSADSDGVDLSDKVILITGANSGIGLGVATYCASKKAKVYMLCRSIEKANIAREQIIKDTSCAPDNIKVVKCDVSLTSSVKETVSNFLSVEKSPVHAVVCNAGVLLNTLTLTSEGKETTFASHLLNGSYLLTKLMLPLMSKESGRVVYVSSGGMYTTKFPSYSTAASTGAKSAEKYSGNLAYAFAKRGQVLLASYLSDAATGAKMNPSNIPVLSCHPGWVDTPAVEEAYGSQKKYLEPMRTPWQGAEGICHLISAEQKSVEGGGFYLDREVVDKHVGGWFGRTGNSAKEVEGLMEKMEADVV